MGNFGGEGEDMKYLMKAVKRESPCKLAEVRWGGGWAGVNRDEQSPQSLGRTLGLLWWFLFSFYSCFLLFPGRLERRM